MIRIFLLLLYYFCVTNSPLVNLYYSGLSNNLIIVILFLVSFDLVTNFFYSETFRLLMVLIGVVIFLFLQYVLVNGSILQFQIGIFRYLITPLMAFYAVILMKKKAYNVFSFLLPVVLFNIFIVYWRIFIDYTFFGIIKIENFDNLSDSYSFGLELWRPSSLESPIIFSIGLVLFIFLLKNELILTKSRRTLYYLVLLLSLIPLLAMRSRSSFIILFGTFLFNYSFFNTSLRKIFYFILLAFPIFTLSSFIGLDKVLLLSDDSLVSRSDSLVVAFSNFIKAPLLNIFFGYGSGYANFELIEGNGFLLYVENFFMSFLFDYGLIVSIPVLLLNVFYLFSIFRKRDELTKVTFSLLILVNMFSSNLTAFSVLFLYFIILFGDLLTYPTQIRFSGGGCNAQ